MLATAGGKDKLLMDGPYGHTDRQVLVDWLI